MARRKQQRPALGPIALAALSLGTSGADGSASWAPPSDAAGPAFADDAESSPTEAQRRRQLLREQSTHPSPEQRREAILRMVAGGIDLSEDTEDLLIMLASDPEPVVRRTLAVSLGLILPRLPPLDSFYLLAAWTTAAQPELRWAIACALCRPFAIAGARSALACLASDPDRQVRRVAVQAIRRRGIVLAASDTTEPPGPGEPDESSGTAAVSPRRSGDPNGSRS